MSWACRFLACGCLTHVTEAGNDIINIAREILAKVESIKAVSRETLPDQGKLTLHRTRRAILTQCDQRFMDKYRKFPPSSAFSNCDLAAKGRNFAIATDRYLYNDLVMLPCYAGIAVLF